MLENIELLFSYQKTTFVVYNIEMFTNVCIKYTYTYIDVLKFF